jgi:hypothetical protein
MRPPRALPQAKLGATHISIIECHSTSCYAGWLSRKQCACCACASMLSSVWPHPFPVGAAGERIKMKAEATFSKDLMGNTSQLSSLTSALAKWSLPSSYGMHCCRRASLSAVPRRRPASCRQETACSYRALVVRFMKTYTLAARDFSARRGASDEHIPQWICKERASEVCRTAALRVAPNLACGGVARRLQTHCGYAPSSRLATGQIGRNKCIGFHETDY